MRAIDLYAGIGGWSLGLRLAGIEVVHSYEWWQPAIDTHNGNHSTQLEPINIRTMELDTLPNDIDFVVGSPPCTQFSYSNRGGNGDLADGLVDLVRFFEIVDYLQPKYWAMENVPRVAKVLAEGFTNPESELFRFRHLKPNLEIFDFSEFGCPQARRRCIATNIPIKNINAVKKLTRRITLGEVIDALAESNVVTDPVWAVELSSNDLTELEKEEALNEEELRLNRESKIYHPVYNNMSFPDRLELPARTVTATCTRVSRESIVVKDSRSKDYYRRLTIRERASLQGFPITYQFYGKSFAEKTKMIGNAIPPTFTYVLASLAKGVTVEDFVPHAELSGIIKLPSTVAPKTKVDTAGKAYSSRRRFRAAIPNLRFKSGMRFEFANSVENNAINWSMRFFSGNSKNISTHKFDHKLAARLEKYRVLEGVLESLNELGSELLELVASADMQMLQDIWTRRQQGKSPYLWVDQIGRIADRIYQDLEDLITSETAEQIVLDVVGLIDDKGKYQNEAKLRKYSMRILSGVLVGVWFNSIPWGVDISQAA